MPGLGTNTQRSVNRPGTWTSSASPASTRS